MVAQERTSLSLFATQLPNVRALTLVSICWKCLVLAEATRRSAPRSAAAGISRQSRRGLPQPPSGRCWRQFHVLRWWPPGREDTRQMSTKAGGLPDTNKKGIPSVRQPVHRKERNSTSQIASSCIYEPTQSNFNSTLKSWVHFIYESFIFLSTPLAAFK